MHLFLPRYYFDDDNDGDGDDDDGDDDDDAALKNTDLKNSMDITELSPLWNGNKSGSKSTVSRNLRTSPKIDYLFFYSGLGHLPPQKPKTKVDCFGLFWIVSDRFGSFSDRCNFRTRYPIVSDYFRIVFGRIRGRAMYTEAPLIGTAHWQHRLIRIPVEPHGAL